jgi:hypothetical protein
MQCPYTTNDQDWAYEEAVCLNSGYYPASCLEELSKRKNTLSQENHFPPKIQTRYATNSSQKHHSFSQLVWAHAQNFYVCLMWTEYNNIFCSHIQQGFTKQSHFSDTTAEV